MSQRSGGAERRKHRRVPMGRAILKVAEVGGDRKTRAEVRSISMGQDGRPRLHLLFLDASAPERLLPGVGAEEAASKPPGG